MIMLENCGFATITINVDCAHLIICCAGCPQLIKIVAANTELCFPSTEIDMLESSTLHSAAFFAAAASSAAFFCSSGIVCGLLCSSGIVCGLLCNSGIVGTPTGLQSFEDS